MKKIIALIVVIIIVIAYFGFRGNSRTTSPTGDTSLGTSFHPDPSNATFTFDNGPITLSNGEHSAPLAPGSAVEEETRLTDIRGYGDVNSDKKNDTAVILVQSGGASGVFIYLAAYVSGPVTYKGTNAIFIGDRITPKSVSVSNGVITVNYLDRREDEPFAAEPTVPTTEQFVYRNGSLERR